MAIDKSGNGAVLCTWEILSNLASTLSACGGKGKENEEIREAFEHAVEDINVFIVANSLTPVKKEELEMIIAKERSEKKEKMMKLSKQDFEKECTSGSASEMIRGYKSMWGSKARDEIKNMTRELLSVPRPPVINPCL